MELELACKNDNQHQLLYTVHSAKIFHTSRHARSWISILQRLRQMNAQAQNQPPLEQLSSPRLNLTLQSGAKGVILFGMKSASKMPTRTSQQHEHAPFFQCEKINQSSFVAVSLFANRCYLLF